MENGKYVKGTGAKAYEKNVEGAVEILVKDGRNLIAAGIKENKALIYTKLRELFDNKKESLMAPLTTKIQLEEIIKLLLPADIPGELKSRLERNFSDFIAVLSNSPPNLECLPTKEEMDSLNKHACGPIIQKFICDARRKLADDVVLAIVKDGLAADSIMNLFRSDIITPLLYAVDGREPPFEVKCNSLIETICIRAEGLYKRLLTAVLHLQCLSKSVAFEKCQTLGALMKQLEENSKGSELKKCIDWKALKIRNDRAHHSINIDVKTKIVTFLDNGKRVIGPWSLSELEEYEESFRDRCLSITTAFLLSRY